MSILPDDKKLRALDRYALAFIALAGLAFGYLKDKECKECYESRISEKGTVIETYKQGYESSNDVIKIMFNYERPKITDSVYSPAVLQRANR